MATEIRELFLLIMTIINALRNPIHRLFGRNVDLRANNELSVIYNLIWALVRIARAYEHGIRLLFVN